MNKKVYFGIGALAVAILAGVYFTSAEKFLGKLTPSETSKTASASAEQWWCISDEEYAKKYPSTNWDSGVTPTEVKPGGGTAKGSIFPWNNGIYTPGFPGGAKTDITKPIGSSSNVKSGTSISGSQLPDFNKPLVGLNTNTPGGSRNGSGIPTIVGSGVDSGTPRMPDVTIPSGGTEQPEEDNLYAFASCGCGVGKKITVSEIGQDVTCSKQYGDYQTFESHKPDGTPITVVMSTAPKAECFSRYECPKGDKIDYSELYETCNPSKIGYDQTCNKSSVPGADILRVCDAFYGQTWKEQVEATKAEKKLCISDKDCEKYLQMAKDGAFTSNVKGKPFNEVAKSCSSQGSDKPWNDYWSWMTNY